MQVAAILGAVFAVAASGAAVQPRDAILYNISGFSAFCMPHSVQCGYGFAVISSAAPAGANKTICGNLIIGPDNLPPLPLTSCFEPEYSYAVAIANGGLTLSVTSALDANTNITGTHTATADQFIIQNGGTTMSQIYVGPQNFTIETVEVAV
ncbi:putative 22kda glyco protein [Rosellinia necatrix]|uniref:Putative 22kda glyco protein n=1 Tax=Rosellinia necatrix TaxID=77044 RepID=A0A1W2TNK5_ROSNE|nr:putative 22kda glyco protein [Rosellinia necatrix]